MCPMIKRVVSVLFSSYSCHTALQFWQQYDSLSFSSRWSRRLSSRYLTLCFQSWKAYISNACPYADSSGKRSFGGKLLKLYFSYWDFTVEKRYTVLKNTNKHSSFVWAMLLFLSVIVDPCVTRASGDSCQAARMFCGPSLGLNEFDGKLCIPLKFWSELNDCFSGSESPSILSSLSSACPFRHFFFFHINALIGLHPYTFSLLVVGSLTYNLKGWVRLLKCIFNLLKWPKSQRNTVPNCTWILSCYGVGL